MGSSVNDQPTTTSPSASCGNCHGCKSQHPGAESNGVGACQKLCSNSPGRACGNAADADRRNAIQRQKVLDKALLFAIEFRDPEYMQLSELAWDTFTAAVDELAGVV